MQTSPAMPRVLLLCGADLLASLAAPGIWQPEHVQAIFEDFGVVCVPRPGCSTADLLAPGVCHR